MAAPEPQPPLLPRRTLTIGHRTLHVVTFADRRPASMPASAHDPSEEEFLFQSEMETLLFEQAPIGQTGAMYRLLQRAGVGGRAIALRRASVAQGLLSDAEFDDLRSMLHSGFRVFTLVPMDAVQV